MTDVSDAPKKTLGGANQTRGRKKSTWMLTLLPIWLLLPLVVWGVFKPAGAELLLVLLASTAGLVTQLCVGLVLALRR